jgi:hypothetical protein
VTSIDPPPGLTRLPSNSPRSDYCQGLKVGSRSR